MVLQIFWKIPNHESIPRENVPAALFGGVHEVQIPGMQAADICITTGREGAKNVERLCGLVVSINHVFGVVTT